MNSITKKHHGHSIKRIREIQQIKQKTVADALSKTLKENWDQGKVSLLEDKEEIDGDLLEVIAPILNVTPDIIRNFDSESMFTVFATNNDGHDYSSTVNFHCTFNPLDKLIQVYDELLKAKDDAIKAKDALISVLKQKTA